MATTKTDLLAQIDADIAKLTEMRAYVLAHRADEPSTPKVRKPRGPNKKRGLPSEEPSL